MTNPFKHKSDKIMIDFICENCGHHFKRGVKHVFVHIPTLFDEIKKKPTKHSPFIIPYEMICPVCSAINQYKLDIDSSLRIKMAFTTLTIMNKDFSEHNHYHYTIFGLLDGAERHPIDAINYYQEEVSKDPDDLKKRILLGNSYRMVGQFEEAEDQYEQVLDGDKSQLEAWFGLASVHISRNQRRLAKAALKNIIKNMPEEPEEEDINYTVVAHFCLNGQIPLEILATDEMMLEEFKEIVKYIKIEKNDSNQNQNDQHT